MKIGLIAPRMQSGGRPARLLPAAGGAFLEWLEGKTPPGVAALEAAAG